MMITNQKRPTKETCKRDIFNRKETKIDQTLYLRAKKKWLRSRIVVCACAHIVGEFRGLLTTELWRPINLSSPYSQFVAVCCGVMQCDAVCCSESDKSRFALFAHKTTRTQTHTQTHTHTHKHTHTHTITHAHTHNTHRHIYSCGYTQLCDHGMFWYIV